MKNSASGPIFGLVLAGGQGRRLGGADKGLLAWRGRPLVELVVDRLRPQVEALAISANRNAVAYAHLGLVVLPDCLGPVGTIGPLAGVLAGLDHFDVPGRNALMVTVPVDAPRLPADLVARLLAALVATGAVAAVAYAGGRLQPTFALMRTALRPRLQDFLAAGGRRADAWYEEIEAVRVRFDIPNAFLNLNTPEDFADRDIDRHLDTDREGGTA